MILEAELHICTWCWAWDIISSPQSSELYRQALCSLVLYFARNAYSLMTRNGHMEYILNDRKIWKNIETAVPQAMAEIDRKIFNGE